MCLYLARVARVVSPDSIVRVAIRQRAESSHRRGKKECAWAQLLEKTKKKKERVSGLV